MATGQDMENDLLNEEEPTFPSETIAGWGQERDSQDHSASATVVGESSQTQNHLLPAVHLPAPVRVLTGFSDRRN